MYQSEIRDSTIYRLSEKVREKNYGNYLLNVKLKRIRGFDDQMVTFDFPVTALIGPNGGGKTTILGAAACAYKIMKPGYFFAKSGNLDDSMQNWTIEYELIDKNINKHDTIRRTASYKKHKWKRNAPNRNVTLFGVSRTTPVTERKEFRKFVSSRFLFELNSLNELENTVSIEVDKILGKDISKYSFIQIGQSGNVSLLAGKTKKGSQYSEFHFGAGESSIIRMVMEIESLPENSLILIEEIENGLHPIATTKIVEYLIDIADRKKAQVIFTTHSEDALNPLPSNAIWSAIDFKVEQGKLTIHSLRSMNIDIKKRLVIFVEDKFSEEWVKSLLRSYGNISVDLIGVHEAKGDGKAVVLNRNHNQDPSINSPSVCFIDGDSHQSESLEERVFKLPGEKPEVFIYDSVVDMLHEVSGELAVRLHQPFERGEDVANIIRDIRRNNRDSHLLYSQLGKKLGLIEPNIIISGFLSIWSEKNENEVRKLLSPIEDLIPKEQKEIENSGKTNSLINAENQNSKSNEKSTDLINSNLLKFIG